MNQHRIISAAEATEIASFMNLETVSISCNSAQCDAGTSMTIKSSFRPMSSDLLLFLGVRELNLKLESCQAYTEEVHVLSISDRGMEDINYRVVSKLGTFCFSFLCKQILHEVICEPDLVDMGQPEPGSGTA